MVEIWGPVITWYTYGESEERASEQCSDGYLVYGVQMTLAVCDRRPLSAALLHSGQSWVWIHGTQRTSTHSMQLRAVHKTRSWRWTSRTHPWGGFRCCSQTSQTSRERARVDILLEDWKIIAGKYWDQPQVWDLPRVFGPKWSLTTQTQHSRCQGILHPTNKMIRRWQPRVHTYTLRVERVVCTM